jgi:hypothetical protein
MSSTVAFPPLEIVLAPSPQADDALRRQLWGVLSAVYPQSRIAERRMDQRYPYPHLLYLTPLADDGVTPAGEAAAVVGKALSQRGMGFFHQQPIPYRRMIASMETAELHWAGFLIDITWCRFTRYGWYESGGRFIQCVPSPIARAGR